MSYYCRYSQGTENHPNNCVARASDHPEISNDTQKIVRAAAERLDYGKAISDQDLEAGWIIHLTLTKNFTLTRKSF